MGFGKKLAKSEKGFIVISTELFPPGWAYVDTVGEIHAMEFGGYVNRGSGSIYGKELGAYANRE